MACRNMAQGRVNRRAPSRSVWHAFECESSYRESVGRACNGEDRPVSPDFICNVVELIYAESPWKILHTDRSLAPEDIGDFDRIQRRSKTEACCLRYGFFRRPETQYVIGTDPEIRATKRSVLGVASDASREL